jgi:prefoldin subunit 5
MTILIWALKNWKLAAAGIGVLVLISIGSGLYVKGRLDASHAAEVRLLRENEARLKQSIALTNKLVEAAAAQAAKDEAELEQWQGQANELLIQLEDADRQCFSANDTNGLRSLWK